MRPPFLTKFLSKLPLTELLPLSRQRTLKGPVISVTVNRGAFEQLFLLLSMYKIMLNAGRTGVLIWKADLKQVKTTETSHSASVTLALPFLQGPFRT